MKYLKIFEDYKEYEEISDSEYMLLMRRAKNTRNILKSIKTYDINGNQSKYPVLDPAYCEDFTNYEMKLIKQFFYEKFENDFNIWKKEEDWSIVVEYKKIRIFGSNTESYQFSCVINKFEDEYFYVYIRGKAYKCDQIRGLIQCLEASFHPIGK